MNHHQLVELAGILAVTNAATIVHALLRSDTPRRLGRTIKTRAAGRRRRRDDHHAESAAAELATGRLDWTGATTQAQRAAMSTPAPPTFVAPIPPPDPALDLIARLAANTPKGT